MNTRLLATVPLLWTSLVVAAPDVGESVDATLARYGNTSGSFAKQMDAPVPKKSALQRSKNRAQIFDAHADFVAAKDKVRAGVLKLAVGGKPASLVKGRSPIQDNDNAAELSDSTSREFLTNLAEMDRRGLTQGAAAVQPWSDDYWGIYKGVLGARYADQGFLSASSEDWTKFHNYVMQPEKTASSIFDKATLSEAAGSQLDELSPSEKYDLLVGDAKGSLTAWGWAEGQKYMDTDKKVATWMGICHGWSPAAFQIQRPRYPVKLKSLKGGKEITFYPADIKALASLLWANGAPNAKFMGGRCNTKNPKKDKSGRVLDQDCFDTNPGAWHMAAVNKLGVEKRSFVMDVTYDIEVWNQPTSGYKYTYFNPQTMKRVKTLAEATVTPAQFTNDKFKEFRGKRGQAPASIVGIAMDAEYVVEVQPDHVTEDNQSLDATDVGRWMYDLELDAQGNIIGGEWYSNAHPDFVWTYDSSDTAQSSAESSATGAWRPTVATIPATWSAAASAASRYGQPLAKIVKALVERSQRPPSAGPQGI